MQVKVSIMLKELTMNEKKLFDVVLACDKFWSYIIGSEVEVHMDHQGLTEIITTLLENMKYKLIRWHLLFH
jgi:hypothetical protein